MTLLSSLPSLDVAAVRRSLAASTSIRASAQAMRRRIARGESSSVQSLLSGDHVRQIDSLARDELDGALSRLPPTPKLDASFKGLIRAHVEAFASADMARDLVRADSLGANGVRAFCEGSGSPLTAPAEHAAQRFADEVARLSHDLPAFSGFRFEDQWRLVMGYSHNTEIVGDECFGLDGEFPFALGLPEGVYGVIQDRWHTNDDGQTDWDALKALHFVGELVVPPPFLTPLDVLNHMGMAGFSPMLEESWDAVIEGLSAYGREEFLQMIETESPLPDSMEPALYVPEPVVQEMVDLYLKESELSRFVAAVTGLETVTEASARVQARSAPAGLREPLEAILDLLSLVETLAPEPAADHRVMGSIGGFCCSTLYPELMEWYVNHEIHCPLMEGCDRSTVVMKGDVPGCIRYYTLRLMLFRLFLDVLTDEQVVNPL